MCARAAAVVAVVAGARVPDGGGSRGMRIGGRALGGAAPAGVVVAVGFAARGGSVGVAEVGRDGLGGGCRSSENGAKLDHCSTTHILDTFKCIFNELTIILQPYYFSTIFRLQSSKPSINNYCSIYPTKFVPKTANKILKRISRKSQKSDRLPAAWFKCRHSTEY